MGGVVAGLAFVAIALTGCSSGGSASTTRDSSEPTPVATAAVAPATASGATVPTTTRPASTRPATTLPAPATTAVPAGDAFFVPPDPLPATEPGTLLRARQVPGPQGFTTWQILYVSQRATGEPVAVSGLVSRKVGLGAAAVATGAGPEVSRVVDVDPPLLQPASAIATKVSPATTPSLVALR